MSSDPERDARPLDLPVSMIPKVTWRPVLPADVLSALKTLGPLRGFGRIIAYRGQDVETLLGWTFSELDLAEKATSTDDKERHASQVVVHAKKALDCLFDAYLERDFLGAEDDKAVDALRAARSMLKGEQLKHLRRLEAVQDRF